MQLLERLRRQLAYHEQEAAKWRRAIATLTEVTANGQHTELSPVHRRAPRGLQPKSIPSAILRALESGPADITTLAMRVSNIRAKPTNRGSMRVEINRMVKSGLLTRSGPTRFGGLVALVRPPRPLAAKDPGHETD